MSRSTSVLATDDEEGDESVLRLSLLWDELREKAIGLPTAVLGLIDIANSRDAVASTWEVLEPAIANAVTNAAESMDAKRAWNFLTALLEKFGTDPLTGIVSKALRSAGTKPTQRDWGSALTYLGGEAPIERDNSEELLQSIAISLATVDPHQLTGALVAVSPERLLKIALLDDGLLARIFSATDDRFRLQKPRILLNLTVSLRVFSIAFSLPRNITTIATASLYLLPKVLLKVHQLIGPRTQPKIVRNPHVKLVGNCSRHRHRLQVSAYVVEVY